MGLPLAAQVLRQCVTGGVTALSLASLRWHYPDQVRRVFLTRASQRCTGPLAFATLRQRADYTPRFNAPTIADSVAGSSPAIRLHLVRAGATPPVLADRLRLRR